MERLHHLFENQPNIIVILAYDGTKLSHVIKNIYGIEEQDVQHFMRKFIDFSVQLDNGLVSDSFWERHRDYLDKFDKISDIELQDLSQFSSRLFNNIDVRTQEKIIDRIAILHNLAFGDLSHPSILYFELLHQIISYRYPAEHIGDWIPEIGNTSRLAQIDCLGKDLYEYIKMIENDSYKGNMIVNVDIHGTYHELLDGYCALAYWYIATLKHPVKNGTCNKYFLRDSNKYDKIVAAVKEFDKLSAIIK